MKVKDAMHKGVEWVGPDTPVTEIAKLMKKHDVGSIPVGENDQLIGMVTDRDIVCKGLAQDGFDAESLTARDVMTEGIHCCREDDDLSKAVQHMESLQIRRLPVINKSKRMVGMLALGDISRMAPSKLLSECVKSVAAHHGRALRARRGSSTPMPSRGRPRLPPLLHWPCQPLSGLIHEFRNLTLPHDFAAHESVVLLRGVLACRGRRHAERRHP